MDQFHVKNYEESSFSIDMFSILAFHNQIRYIIYHFPNLFEYEVLVLYND